MYIVISTLTQDMHELVTELLTFGRVADMAGMKTDEVSAMYGCMDSYNACS